MCRIISLDHLIFGFPIPTPNKSPSTTLFVVVDGAVVGRGFDGVAFEGIFT